MPPEPSGARKMWGRLAAALIGALLLAHLVRRADPSRLWAGIASVGWGLVLVIALAGLSHLVRTWAWRLTLPDARRRPSFWQDARIAPCIGGCGAGRRIRPSLR